ncbi:hypothetical protein ACM46_06560 [Chryseobacterium angstadtii]|uniref:Uncharacterized protein n=1 Tax=Chryseobacterium angstadtii TaxID=558151 RepID=A0A0J7IHS2_9FLAO|nr:hypothetical protein [Chryseobacterium angstadtii]KMQ65541.1 hypothetical protein ACM46_06560 [Chryseobacterium angstadtii]
MKNLFLTLAFLASASVWGQQVVSSDSKAEKKPSRPLIERTNREQNDSIAKKNVGSFMQKNKYSESYIKSSQNSSAVQYNVNQLQQNNMNFNNTNNGSYISPSGTVVNTLPLGNQRVQGSASVGVPVFKTK